MPEAVRRGALNRILEPEETPSDASDKEWQKVPAFSLRVELSNGQGVEGFAWAHYAGYGSLNQKVRLQSRLTE